MSTRVSTDVLLTFQVPLIVQNEDDVITAGSNQMADNIVPIFCVSSVTGYGLQLLTRFLHVLPPGVSLKEKDRLEQVCVCCSSHPIPFVSFQIYLYMYAYLIRNLVSFKLMKLFECQKLALL